MKRLSLFFCRALLACGWLLPAPGGAAESLLPSLPSCADKLDAKDQSSRLAGAQGLGAWGTAAKGALPQVLDLLREKDVLLQAQAAQTLAQIGPPALPALRAALKDKRLSVRYRAADALRLMGPEAREAVPDLLEATGDPHVCMRTNALKALLAIEPRSEKTKEALRKALKDKHPALSTLAEVWLKDLEAKGDERQQLLNPQVFARAPRFSLAQERMMDQIVADFIATDTHALGARGIRPHVPREAYALIWVGGPETIPALVRGVNRGVTLMAACPFGMLVTRLENLIRECRDPELLEYAIQNLGRGIPPDQARLENFLASALRARVACARRVAELQLLTAAAARQKELAPTLVDLKEDELKARLTDSDADVRTLAAAIAFQRRLPWVDEYVGLLTDPDMRVVQSARQALVSLARGTDFGPPPKAESGACRQSQALWREWWKYQDANPHKVEPPGGAATTTLRASLRLPSPADRLGPALVKAPANKRGAVLAQLREGKGVEYTDALAEATHQLDGAWQRRAREALAQRLERMTTRTLQDKLTEEDAEVRRAAAVACGQKGDVEMVPDLIPLLTDEDGGVASAARAALRKLTGEDFGPAPNATRAECLGATKKWRQWWASREER